MGHAAAIYLGIPEGVRFSLSQVSADLLVVELLSVYCLHYQEQARYCDALLKLIDNNPDTRGRISSF